MPAIDLITLEADAARETVPALPQCVQAELRSYLGRAAARGLQLPGL